MIDDDFREASFYFMLHDFEASIKADGVEYILSRLDPDILRKIKAYLNDN